MDLDQLLDGCAPSVTPRTPQLDEDLHHLVAATEAAHIRRRRPVRVALVSGAIVAVMGFGAAASAGGVLPGWPSFATSSGQTCAIEVVAKRSNGDGEPNNSRTFSADEQAETLAAAQRYLDHFDYDSVDRNAAIAWWRTEENKARAMQSDPRERQPRLRGDDLEVEAVSSWVVDHLRAHLAGQGLDIRAINVVTSDTGCVL